MPNKCQKMKAEWRLASPGLVAFFVSGYSACWQFQGMRRSPAHGLPEQLRTARVRSSLALK